MFPAIAAASSAIDALKALTSSKPTTGVNQDGANLFAFAADASTSTGATSGSGAGKSSPISPETMSALLDAQGQSGPGGTSRSDALKDLFSQIDVDGDGKLSKSEFENALGAGGTNVAKADDVFSKLDKDGDGSVNLDELMSALKGKGGHHRHHAQPAVDASGNPLESDPLMQALDSSLSTSAANASASSAATSTYNFMDQLVQRQSSLVSAQASSSLSVSV